MRHRRNRWHKPQGSHPALTAERLRSIIRYWPQTGEFFWTGVKQGTRPSRAGRRERSIEKYCYISIDGHRYPAHRLAWLYTYGEWPEGGVDHKNRRRNDNRIENLRLADRSQNAANARVSTFSRTGVKGVSRIGNKFRASINVRGKRRQLGVFDDLKDAADAYARAAKREFGEFAFPDREPAVRCYGSKRAVKTRYAVEPITISPLSKLYGLTNESSD